ncbi:MAG: single-stranded DNA-binding protein [Deltaproteobacteria bacterium]|nr:single-stranded DNA-binding protein [Deltaproteobacteria bacterium]
MADFNRVILMGRLTRDPELRYTPNGTAVANLSLAVNRRWKGDDQVREETSFFDIVVFGKQAENCSEYLGKGRPILIEGRLQQRRWETDDGQKRSKIEVVASNVQFLGSGKSDTNRSEKGGDDSPPEFDDKDIPF